MRTEFVWTMTTEGNRLPTASPEMGIPQRSRFLYYVYLLVLRNTLSFVGGCRRSMARELHSSDVIMAINLSERTAIACTLHDPRTSYVRAIH